MFAYDNFIVDLGGVLYRIDESNASNGLMAFSELCRSDFLLVIETEGFKNIIANYEKGIISTKQFYEGMCNSLKLKCSLEEFKIAWNSTLYCFFDDAVENIKKLQSKGNVVLLSNTNELHFRRFEPESRGILPLFDACFFSFQIGMRKPDQEIFCYVIDKMNFDPKKTIFIDDSLMNIESARGLGLSVFHIKKKGLREFIEFMELL